jgi:hypothetical protein
MYARTQNTGNFRIRKILRVPSSVEIRVHKPSYAENSRILQTCKDMEKSSNKEAIVVLKMAEINEQTTHGSRSSKGTIKMWKIVETHEQAM